VVHRLKSSREFQHQADHLRSLLDSATSDRNKLAEQHQCLVQQMDALTMDHQKLQSANSELQRQRNELTDDKADLHKEVERQQNENDRWYLFFDYFE